MMQKYQLIVFDWEGTIAQDLLGIVLCIIEQKIQIFDGFSFDKLKAREDLALCLPYTISKAFPELSLHQQEELLRLVNNSLSENTKPVFLIDGVLNFIVKLSKLDLGLAIATNKGEESLAKVLTISGLDKYFSITRSPGRLPPKPCSDMLCEILQVFSVEPSQALMIGDSILDIEMAKSIGVDAIGLDIYDINHSELLNAGALRVFNSFNQIEIFLGLHP